MSESIDFSRPPEGSLFDPVASPRGLRLALVFGNESPTGRCPFYNVQCIHCDLGAGEGVSFTPEMNRGRLAFIKEHFKNVLPEICHLVIYNYGSTLNDSELSKETRHRILEFAASLASVKRISFDSREQFVTAERVNDMIAALRPDQSMSITLGFESQSEEVRIGHLKKSITREEVDAVFVALSGHNGRTAVEMNVLFQPPGITGNEAIIEAVATIEYGIQMMKKHGVLVDFNFHPYYPSIKGTKFFPDHPRAMMEHAIRSLFMIIRMIKQQSPESRIFVGWNDEGHDLQPTVKKMKQLLYSPAFAAFNVSQNEDDLQI
ncbi:MAG: hypothetical protein CVV42_15880 [Candidatus Riflebacteria bacterium HGW-Riflebacteria-2]|jgi:hypothetical protein|nr:MAG: hypothetical protein CVV42_15880 [Candidatus Riflebacteria bacterium HGW-Riflebacteria-2]